MKSGYGVELTNPLRYCAERMPRIFRSMRRDGDRPLVAAAADGLGARVPPALGLVDIYPTSAGQVSPVTGPQGEGMSVAPDWRVLPPHRIPDRLRSLRKDARGSKSLFCWFMGRGPFVADHVAEGLRLHPDADNITHGVVEPARTMHVDEYQQALAATRPAWDIIEEDPER